jgi:hypothetical protein
MSQRLNVEVLSVNPITEMLAADNFSTTVAYALILHDSWVALRDNNYLEA